MRERPAPGWSVASSGASPQRRRTSDYAIGPITISGATITISTPPIGELLVDCRTRRPDRITPARASSPPLSKAQAPGSSCFLAPALENRRRTSHNGQEKSVTAGQSRHLRTQAHMDFIRGLDNGWFEKFDGANKSANLVSARDMNTTGQAAPHS